MKKYWHLIGCAVILLIQINLFCIQADILGKFDTTFSQYMPRLGDSGPEHPMATYFDTWTFGVPGFSQWVLVPLGMHIGVVEVVLVDVEVVGVVVEVLVEVLVEVVLVVVVGAAVVVVVGLSHAPVWSPWSRWLATALLETSMVFSSGVPGLWQMVTFSC